VFPHLVEMHHKYEKQGIVVVSVSTDEIDKDEAKKTPAVITAKVKGFVAELKAPFNTLILDEPLDVHESKLHFTAPPAVFVFNRQGKWVQLVPEDENDKGMKIYNGRIEKKVVEFLNEK
jgi:hypothetical protein